MRNSMIYVLFSMLSVASSFRQHNIPPLVMQRKTTKLLAFFWGNYKSDGKKEAKIGLALAVLLCIKSNFSSIEIR